MGLRSIRIGKLAGIPIGIQPLWLLIVALITWSLGAAYYPNEVDGIAPALSYALGLASALLLFLSILLHELGHALVARRHGVEIEEIDLWLLGGVARMSSYPDSARDELRYAIAGPAVTAAIVALFGVVALLLPSSTSPEARAVVDYQLFVNAAILVFNLLPAFPLDGGRIARALLWWRWGDIERATAAAASLGRGLGYGMIGLGVFATLAGAIGGLWFALIGIFVVAAARAEQTGLEVHTAFSGREAGRLASFPAVTVSAGASVEDAVEDYFVVHRFQAFPVLEGGEPIGLIDAATVNQVPARVRPRTSVGEVAIRDSALFVDEDQDVAELLERPVFQRVGRAVVRAGDGGIGILSRTDVERALRAWEMRRNPTMRPHSAA